MKHFGECQYACFLKIILPVTQNFLGCSITGNQLIISVSISYMFICFNPYLWFQSQDSAPTVQTGGVNQGEVSNIEVFLRNFGSSQIACEISVFL